MSSAKPVINKPIYLLKEGRLPPSIESILKKIIPKFIINAISIFYPLANIFTYSRFLKENLGISFKEKVEIIKRAHIISKNVEGYHSQKEIFEIITEILKLSNLKGILVEAGCWKGASTCKLSIAAKLVNKKLYVFDSFEGLPEPDKKKEGKLFLEELYKKGLFKGSLDEVKNNVKRYGEIDNCIFIKGLFEKTMTSFDENIAVAFLDVDYASSTKICLKNLYPLIVPNGVIFSHDGHLPWVREIIFDDAFWQKEVKTKIPKITTKKNERIVRMKKQDSA